MEGQAVGGSGEGGRGEGVGVQAVREEVAGQGVGSDGKGGSDGAGSGQQMEEEAVGEAVGKQAVGGSSSLTPAPCLQHPFPCHLSFAYHLPLCLTCLQVWAPTPHLPPAAYDPLPHTPQPLTLILLWPRSSHSPAW